MINLELPYINNYIFAGGVGAVNYAKWLKEYLTDHAPSANLSLLLDSSWFINFKGDIEREFHTALTSEDGQTLFSIISHHTPCSAMETGAPCCISANCMLSRAEFYPQDVPVFALISLYDVFLLGASLEGLVELASEEVRQDEECDTYRT